jgi:hypothetical protein
MPGNPLGSILAPDLPAPKFHDVTVVRRKTVGRARVQGVPPEECGIERQARSIRDCGYFYHRVLRRQADLIGEGFDPEQVRALPTYVTNTNTEETSRDTVNENTGTGGDKGMNSANRFVRIIEHYVRMDYEGNNKAKLYRVVTGGEIGEILDKDGETQIIEEDDIPFASMTPIIVTHRFFGRSMADLVIEIQKIKTALTRAMLDNVYGSINQRPEVAESMATDQTLDDLLVTRPLAPIRVKQPGCVTWQQIPTVTDKVLPAIEYMDTQREWRTGVSRQGQGLDPATLQNQSATAGVLQFTATQAKMKLIARIFAETGIRDMFSLLHEVIRKHSGEQEVYRLRNQWVNVNPRDWKRRDDMTINVGLGGGGRGEQVAFTMGTLNIQKELLSGGKSNLVSDANLYNAVQEYAKAVGHKDGDRFFTDPATVPPPQPAPDPKVAQAQAQAAIDQRRAEQQAGLEQQKASHDAQLKQQQMNADLVHQKAKNETDLILAQQKAEIQKQLAIFEASLKERTHRLEMAGKVVDIAGKPRGDGQPPADIHAILDRLTAVLHAPAPVARGHRVVRDAAGRISHTEPI